MGKYSANEKIPRDKWPTPYHALEPLLPFLTPQTRFIEPCANDGRLIRHMQRHGHICVGALDIEPRHPSVKQGDATKARWKNPPLFVTNLPFSRDLMHRLIDHLAEQAPLWTIIQSDWAYTSQATEYMAYCTDIVTIGRVMWIDGSASAGKENYSFYRFDKRDPGPYPGPIFHPVEDRHSRDRRAKHRNAAGA